jgi:AraC-like DNA-binding protein
MAETALDNLRDEALHVRVLRVGNSTIDQSWNYQDISGGFWRCYRNLDAGAVVTANGQRHALVPGRLHLIPPWLNFSCFCRGPVRSLYLHLDATGMPSALVQQLLPRPLALTADPLLDQLCVRLAERLAGAQADPLALACQAKALAFQVFTALLASLPPSGAARWLAHVQGRSRISGALAWIEDYLVQPMDNASLARHCGLSEGQFIRNFRQLIGQTPARYVQERRLARACSRLLHGDEGIDAIALDCGFANRFHFSRVFARRFGVGPAAYRARRG